MKKNMLKVVALTGLVMGGINMAHAASSTTVTVKGSINTVTCDITSSTNAVDLGNYLPADFTAAGAFPAGKTQNFTIHFSGCAGTAKATDQATLKVSGPTAAAGATYFSDTPTSQAAVGLAEKATPTVLLSSGQVINVGKAGDAPATLNNATVDFTTGLISSVATGTASGQNITAPLKFDFIYN